MKHVFIVNPISGQKDAGRAIVPNIIEKAKEHGLDYSIELTREPGHATRLAAEYAEKGGPVRLYAVGGDGTLNQVIQGAYPYANAQVASIPMGSGNDFVRNFGTPQDFLNLDTQIQGSPVLLDLMQVDKGVCMAITSTGLDAEVAYNIPKYRRLPMMGGTAAYNISVVERVLNKLGKSLRITIDGQVHSGVYLIATVCNGQTYGGGYRAAPMAKLDDGLLDVVFVRKVSRLKIAQIIGKYKKGQHWDFENNRLIPSFQNLMEYHRGQEIEIVPEGPEAFILNVDGECGPAKRLYAKAMPAAFWFVLPSTFKGRANLPALSVPAP